MPTDPANSPTAPPLDIKVLRQQGRFDFEWTAGEVASCTFHQVRSDCQCAFCVDEVTGKKLLDPASVQDDITVENIELVGNYAVRIRWSDKHETGLFTWQHLRQICQAS